MTDEVVEVQFVDPTLSFYEELAWVMSPQDRGDDLKVTSVEVGYPEFFALMKARKVFTLPLWTRTCLVTEPKGVKVDADEFVACRQIIDAWCTPNDTAMFFRIRGGQPYTIQIFQRYSPTLVWVFYTVGQVDYTTYAVRRAFWDIGIRNIRFAVDNDLNGAFAQRLQEQRGARVILAEGWSSVYEIELTSRPDD